MGVDPSKMNLDEHMEAYAQIRFIIETNAKDNPMLNMK